MFSADKFQEKIKRSIKWLQSFADRIWYPPFVGFLSAIDNFILIIPNDGILISSCMLTPRRWFYLAVCVSVGSTLGALGFAALIEYQGLPWILNMYPGIDQSEMWKTTDQFFQKYGLIVIFLIAASPLVQQPAVILASLASTPLTTLAVVVFTGRFIKFLIMAYVGSHAPKLLSKMWGVKGELEEVGIHLKK